MSMTLGERRAVMALARAVISMSGAVGILEITAKEQDNAELKRLLAEVKEKLEDAVSIMESEWR